jgi:hypothetical protein
MLRGWVSRSPCTLDSIAAQLDCSESSLHSWLAGTELPDYSFVERMYDILELDWLEKSEFYGCWQMHFEELTRKRDGIFVSYRRSDESSFAGRLHDHLVTHFGAGRFFIDVSSITPGADFVAELQESLKNCMIVLAVIGRGWLTATDSAGQRRLDDPDDFVRLEIETGLTSDMGVVPVLVDDAPMPRAADRPKEIAGLARRQAHYVTNRRFGADIADLLALIERQSKRRSRKLRLGRYLTRLGSIYEMLSTRCPPTRRLH